VEAESASWPDWREAAAYAPLLDADRSLFAWEWLRRAARYRHAAERGETDCDAAAFGLVRFEPPARTVPLARPLWRVEVHRPVLLVERGGSAEAEEAFDLDRLAAIATVTRSRGREHLLLSDGLHAVRLDGPAGIFSSGPACLRYVLEGVTGAEPPLLTLRRLLSLYRNRRFSRSLHAREARARRWILALRAWDALVAGADQREVAQHLLSRSAGDPRWRSREPSVRSQAQRLVRSARAFANGGYRALLL
jgi:hypothetical protein